MPVTVPPIPVPVPTTNDRANFALRADATLGALPAVIAGMNDQNAENNFLHGQIHTKVDQALAAGLANAAANAATASAKAGEAAASAGAAATDAQRAEDAAASAEAVVGLPAPGPGDSGKFLGFDGDEMVWLPAGVRMVTEYLTSGTSWTAPADLVGGSVQYRMVGGGASGGIFTPGNPGAPGGYVEGVAVVVPGDSYPYAIGAGGPSVGPSGGLVSSNAGGATAMFGASAGGGPSGAANVTIGPQATNSGGDFRLSPHVIRTTVSGTSTFTVVGPAPFGVTGVRVGGATGANNVQATGYGVGGAGGDASNASSAGMPGLIVLTYLVST